MPVHELPNGNRRPLPAEAALLLAASRSAIDAGTTRSIVALLEQPVSWPAFYRLAHDHGVLPLAYRQLTAAERAGAPVPSALLGQMRDAASHIATSNLQMTAELVRVSSHLESAGTPVIAYKGPALALRGYGDLSLRHFIDLDVLVRRAHISRVRAALASCGYTASDHTRSTSRQTPLNWGHHESYLSQSGTLLELHWRFVKPLFGAVPEENDIWEAAQSLNVGATPVRVLSPVHEILAVAVHGASHGWQQLSWLCDLAELSARATQTELDALLDLARRLRHGRIVALGLHLAQRLLGVALPASLRQAIARDRGLEDIGTAVTDLLFSTRYSGFRYAKLQIAIRDSRRERIRFAARALLHPTPADVRAVRLPSRLYGLYYLVRPLRVILKYRPRQRSLTAAETDCYRVHPPQVLHPLWVRGETSDVDVFRQVFVHDEFSIVDDLTDVDFVLDCGANVGYSAAYFLSRFADCRVLAVEPDEENFRMLQRNLQPYGSRAQIVRAAVWSHAARLRISNAGDSRAWARQVRECRANERGEFDGIPVSSLLATSGVDRISLLKMDIEGAEAVVFGATSAQWLTKVDAIVIELHQTPAFGNSADVFFSAINQERFVVTTHGERVLCRRDVALP